MCGSEQIKCRGIRCLKRGGTESHHSSATVPGSSSTKQLLQNSKILAGSQLTVLGKIRIHTQSACLSLGVVTALPQRLLFTSEVHVACCDMHNGSGAAPVLRCWGGSNFLLQRWKFDLPGSTSEVFSLGASVISPSSASFHSSC